MIDGEQDGTAVGICQIGIPGRDGELFQGQYRACGISVSGRRVGDIKFSVRTIRGMERQPDQSLLTSKPDECMNIQEGRCEQRPVFDNADSAALLCNKYSPGAISRVGDKDGARGPAGDFLKGKVRWVKGGEGVYEGLAGKRRGHGSREQIKSHQQKREQHLETKINFWFHPIPFNPNSEKTVF